MSEHLNRLGSPTLQEDANGLSLHVSDLSPTSELLLSHLHTTDKEYHVHENDTTREASIEFELKHGLNFITRNTTAQQNHANQYNDHPKTKVQNPKETQRKAFIHEVLHPNIHKPQQYLSSPQELSHSISSPSSGYQSRKSLSKPNFKYELNQYYPLNGDRYGSFISPPSSLSVVDYKDTGMHNYRDVIFQDNSRESKYDKKTNGSNANGQGETRMNRDHGGEKSPLTSRYDGGHFSKVPVKITDGSYDGAVLARQRYNHGGILNGTSTRMNSGILTSKRDLSVDLTPSSRKSLDINNNNSNYGDKTGSSSNSQLNGDHLDEYYWDNGNLPDTTNSENDLFMDATLTTENMLSQIFGKNIQNNKGHSGTARTSSMSKDDPVFSSSDTAAIQHELPDNTLVQTNVTNYYDKLRNFENQEIISETEVGGGGRTGAPLSHRGPRSKSSELPLRENTRLNMSYSLSKSWGSSKTRPEFHSMKMVNNMPSVSRECQEDASRSERVAKMYRIEEEVKLKRAKEFEEGKLLREAFTAWLARTRGLKISADQLCRTHLTRKGMSGLKCAVQCQRRAVDEFRKQRNGIALAKCWEIWQRRTRESVREKMQDTFTQWHYYRLNEEREKLLETIANKHILAKNYAKWKARFNTKQKNSIATLHFKINLVYQYWQCWTLYAKQRRVKNHMNCIASYRYGERVKSRLFLEWRGRTQKSLLCSRLARRRILLKGFFQWKHWTQYAKIVHLRLHNMCKEYHKRCLIKHTFIKWRQALRMKQAETFWKNNQVRRTLKLWKLRYMRKKIHKHLCKALAKKAKKRRFFEKWICFSKTQKEIQSRFVNSMQRFYVRTMFTSWRNETVKANIWRKSIQIYEVENSKRVVERGWKSWKFQMKIMDMRKRCKNSWSLRCVRKSCEVWKLKVRKEKLMSKLEQNRSIWELLFIKRFFRKWKEEQDKDKADVARSLYAANILKKSSLARIFQAWRVVNQEECIIEPLVKRRERKEMARVYDGWRDFLFREKHVRKLEHLRIELLKRKTFGIWRYKLWSITTSKEVEQVFRNSKLRRHFLAWMDHVNDIRLTQIIREQKKEDMTRNFVQIWKQNAEKKVESREREKAENANHRILLVSYFVVWRRKTEDLTKRHRLMTNTADTTHKRLMMARLLKRWSRQYTIVTKTREYLQQKKLEQLKETFLSWRVAVKQDVERRIGDFYSHILDSSLNSTSGYQTSLKNSFASFQFITADEEVVTPVPTPRSRPLTPIMFLDDDPNQAKHVTAQLSYRPVTSDRQHSSPGYQTPPPSAEPDRTHCFPLTRQRSFDQISQSGTSPQRSSEDDYGVPSSGVHSAGEESDQEDRISLHMSESVFSFQTTSDSTSRGRELLLADTIIHWRSLSLSVAFRSWFKYTQHRKHIRVLHTYWVDRNRKKQLTKIIGKWRRWLFVTVLARQQWVMHLKKSCLFVWINYRQEQILNADRKDEADMFSKRRLLKEFFIKWKRKKTTKRQLQSIVGRWQKNAVFTNTDKVIIQQYQEKARTKRLKQTFVYWKKKTRHSQEATIFWETLIRQRCLDHWRSVACYRIELKKTVNTFRNNHIMAKAFTEWHLRFEDYRTAKILLVVTEERKLKTVFNAWQQWASAASYRRKTSLAYHRSQEQNKLRTKFIFWLTVAKQLTAIKEHYHKSLQRRVLRSWKDVLTHKANTSGSLQDFQKIAQRNVLQTWFVFWRKRTEHNQLLSRYLKQKAQRKLASKFEHWRNQKRISDAKAHCSHHLKNKMFTRWRQKIIKRKKARQHFKKWHTIAEGNKLNQVADSVLHDSQNKLLRQKFDFWKKATRHAQHARDYHTTKLTRSFFIEWQVYTRNRKRLSSSLKEFQMSHLKNNSGLLKKCMKIWKMKSSFSRQAENMYNNKMSSKYWKVWRHNYVRRKVSLAMVEHDNKKILSKVFVTWYNITSSHNSLLKEVHNFRLQRWFRWWMARYNDS